MMFQCYDVCAGDFPRLAEERDDSGRLQRAIDACPGGVLYIPRGYYEIASPLRITNFCSVMMHKSAVLRAVREMDFVLSYDGEALWTDSRPRDPYGEPENDCNIFIAGGDIDGRGLAGCLFMSGYRHVTLRDITMHNGRKYGLYVANRGYELVAENLYFRCNISGLAGNTAIYSVAGDSHYTDCIAVDYTVGVYVGPGSGSNRFTRCHIWGGPVPPVREGGIPEMLENSVGYHIASPDTVLRDCYADTSAVGFLIEAPTSMAGCAYYNNNIFGLDHVTVIRHLSGSLSVVQCRFTRTCPDFTVYEGDNRDVTWLANQYAETDDWESAYR